MVDSLNAFHSAPHALKSYKKTKQNKTKNYPRVRDEETEAQEA